MHLKPSSLLLLCSVISLAAASSLSAGVAEVEEPEVAVFEEEEAKNSGSIPEPTVVGLIGFVGCLLMVRRRR